MKLVTADFRSIVQDMISKLEEARDPNQALRTTRVDVKLLGQQYQEAKVGKLALACDEPMHVGGTGRAPTPLEFFVASIGFCENVMFTRHAALLGSEFDSLETSVRGHWDRRGQYEIGGHDSSFKDMNVDTKVNTDAPVEKVVEVTRLTHRRCPMHTTIAKAMKVTDKLFINGKEVPL